MTRFRFTAVVAAIVAGLAAPSIALAQAAPGGTGTGGGPGTTTTPGAAPQRGSEIDLPIGAPQKGFENPEPPDDPEDDPPKIYDEEIPSKTESIIYVLDISGSMDWDSRSYT